MLRGTHGSLNNFLHRGTSISVHEEGNIVRLLTGTNKAIIKVPQQEGYQTEFSEPPGSIVAA
jgi:hypothetical protein